MYSFFLNLKLLCYAISPWNNEANLKFLRKSIEKNKIKWDYVIDIAHSYLLVPSLWVNLRAKNLESYLDEGIRDYLHNFYSLNMQRNIGLRQQTLEAVDVLNNQGIVPLLFKGAAQLFQPIHGHLGSRMMRDLDILIPTKQLGEAVEVLHSIGYQEAVDKNFNQAKHHHWAPLFRSGEYGTIELHHEALYLDAAGVLPAQLIWTNAQRQTVQGVHFFIPDATHSLMIGMIHSRFFDLHRLDLQALLDCTSLVLRYSDHMDWERIRSLMDKNGLCHMLQAYLVAANLLFNLPFPHMIEPTISARMHYMLSLAVLRWKLAKRLSSKYYAFTAQQICKRYQCKNQPLPLTVNRLKYLAESIRDIYEGISYCVKLRRKHILEK